MAAPPRRKSLKLRARWSCYEDARAEVEAFEVGLEVDARSAGWRGG